MHFFRYFITLFMLGLSFTVLGQQHESAKYSDELGKERAKKDKHFKRDDDSPIPITERRKFKGLHYYQINPAYRVEAAFVRDSSQAPFKMKTSTDRMPMYQKYGELHFMLEGKPFVLTVYQNLELIRQEKYRDYLFIPFTDKTNGNGSYGGGRYIDFRIPSTPKVPLDFNQAYNPYCSYSSNYSCPVPPTENDLSISIEAGEKTYKEY